MTNLRQNRHKPDPPERKQLVKRHQGAAVRKRQNQRVPAARLAGAKSASKKGFSLVAKLLGSLAPSNRSERPPVARIPVSPPRENSSIPRKEKESLLKKLLANVAKRPQAQQRPSTPPPLPRESTPQARREGSGVIQRLVESAAKRTQSLRSATSRPSPPRESTPLPAPRREGSSLVQKVIGSVFALRQARRSSSGPRSVPPPSVAGPSTARKLLDSVVRSSKQPAPAQRPPAPSPSSMAPSSGGISLVQQLRKAADRQPQPQRVPLVRPPVVAPTPRVAGSDGGTPLILRLFAPKDRAKQQPRRPFLVRATLFSPPTAPYVDKSNPQARIAFLSGFFMLAFSILTMRALDLTIIQADTLQQRARSQHKKKIIMTANRGRILDRNGRTLAISLPMNSLSVDIDQVENRDQLASSLAPILHIPVGEMRSRMRAIKPGTYPILKRQIPPEVTRKVRNLDHQALFFIPESRRFYTMGEITGHILGFVNFEGRGREGLERTFEDELHGINGAQVISHDRLGRPMPMVKTVTEPHPGTDIAITIDTSIQYVAYRALLKGVQASQAKAGMAVVLDANNGEILALVNQPSFNPNNLAQSRSNDRRNRVVTDLFEPGSTFKVFTIAAAMDVGTINSDTIIDIEFGKTRIADRTITDFHRGTRYHTVAQVLQRSSNVGAAKIGLELGNEHQERYLRKFGFGASTGVELPSDPMGVIPDITHYRKVGLANRSYGYGVTTTPLHIAVAFATSINGGVHYPPTLIKGKIVNGTLVPPTRPEPQRVLSEETSKKLREILKKVVSDEGTAPDAAVDGYQVGGKTGTARKAIPGQGYVAGRYYASFVGYVPADKPRLVIFVSIDEPTGVYYGGKVAAPVFKEIAQEILPRLSVFPDTLTEPQLPDMMEPPLPPYDVVDSSLGRALEILVEKGVVPQIQGSGLVKSIETPKEGPPRLVLQ